MAADILLARANLVPVGDDNQANVELARELARRFNHMYGEIFPIPEQQIEGTLIGTDGKAKMSKSLNNAIFLSDNAQTIERKVMGMYTDPNRITASTPGQVEGNPVFVYHDHFNPNLTEVADLKDRYRKGKVGDVEVKQKLCKALNKFLDPIRQRRAVFEEDPDLVNRILAQGTQQARLQARETMQQVRSAMGITSYQYSEVYQQDTALRNQESTPVKGLAFV
jgi:tryptophanyl-tRNA synthetase